MGIRLEESADRSALYAIYSAAFGQLAEADLVQAMHDDGDLILSLIAFADGPVGHIAFSPVTLSGGAPGWFGLGPVSVHPSTQKQGIGRALIEHGLLV